MWNEAQQAAQISDSWKNAHCDVSGYDEWPLFGDSELMQVRGGVGSFPAAIIAYNHITSHVKVLIKNKEYDRIYSDGVPLQQITESSARAGMERAQQFEAHV
jgi:hypothetical protein